MNRIDLPASPTAGDGLQLADLQAALQQGLPGFADGTLVIDSLRVVKMRRSSSKRRDPHPYTVCLDLALHEAAGGRRHGLRLYGKACRDGASAALFDAARRAPLAPVEGGPALAHLPVLDMVLWGWPNDPGLSQLPVLLDPAALWPALPAAVRAGAVRVLSVQALRYEPEVRATLRCVLEQADGSRREVFGKTFRDGRAELLLQRFRYFLELSRRDPSAPLVAEPLDAHAGTHCLWQAAAPGRPLTSLEGDEACAVFARLGTALAHLHGAPLPTSSERPVAHWLTEVKRRAKKISRVQPQLGERAYALADRLAALAQALPPPCTALIHGDFHPDQVWAHDGRPLLFDFDEFAIGDPMEELAEFVVKLHEAGGGARPALHGAACEAALLDAYRAAAPERWHSGWLGWHRSVQALLQASRAFVFQAPGWPEAMSRWLSAAEGAAAALARTLNEEAPA